MTIMPILTWMEDFRQAPRRVFITHGEREAANAMKRHIEEKFGWDAGIPAYMQQEDL